MSAPETLAKESPSLWRRSLWPLLLCVALPVFGLSLIVEHWLSLEGRLALIVKLALAGVIGVTVGLILDKARDLWRQRRKAEAVAGGSAS